MSVEKWLCGRPKSIINEKNDDRWIKNSFDASRGWCAKFMWRHGFSLRRKTTTGQKNPSYIIDRIVAYLMHVCRIQTNSIFTMLTLLRCLQHLPGTKWSTHKTTVETIGSKEVTTKLNGHDKVRVSVSLTGKADGARLKLFIVFKGATQENKALHNEFHRQYSVASSANGWMNKELTLRWCNEILGQFFSHKLLLAWDSYEAHLTDNVKKALTKSKIETVIVPGGWTKYIQAPDVVWNKPFKDTHREKAP